MEKTQSIEQQERAQERERERAEEGVVAVPVTESHAEKQKTHDSEKKQLLMFKLAILILTVLLMAAIGVMIFAFVTRVPSNQCNTITTKSSTATSTLNGNSATQCTNKAAKHPSVSSASTGNANSEVAKESHSRRIVLASSLDSQNEVAWKRIDQFIETRMKEQNLPKERAKFVFVRDARNILHSGKTTDCQVFDKLPWLTDIQCVDISNHSPAEVESLLNKTDVLMVDGGNVYDLLYILKFKDGGIRGRLIRNAVDNGMIYLGTSAGSVVAGDSLEGTWWKGVDDNGRWSHPVDKKPDDWPDFTENGRENRKGLALVPLNILAHYEDGHQPNLNKTKPDHPVLTLRDTPRQTLVRSGDAITILSN